MLLKLEACNSGQLPNLLLNYCAFKIYFFEFTHTHIPWLLGIAFILKCQAKICITISQSLYIICKILPLAGMESDQGAWSMKPCTAVIVVPWRVPCLYSFSVEAGMRFFFFFFFFSFLGCTCVWKNPGEGGMGVLLEGTPPPTAKWDPSRVCYLYHSSRWLWILNPLSKARNQTASSWILVGFVSSAPQWVFLKS